MPKVCGRVNLLFSFGTETSSEEAIELLKAVVSSLRGTGVEGIARASCVITEVDEQPVESQEYEATAADLGALNEIAGISG
jgi:hypothetical protein